MRILVFGAINAGKSVVASAVASLLPTSRVISIDDYRKRYGDGTHAGEAMAMDKFVADAIDSFDSIVECTGLGPLGRMLHEALPAKESIVVLVAAPLDTCMTRIHLKDFSSTPYPPFEERLPQTIRRCHAEVDRGDLSALWDDKTIWSFTVDGTANDVAREISGLPIRQLTALAAVVRATRSLDPIRGLIWFGSGARGELDKQSDVDLFAVTAQQPERLLQELVERIPGVNFHDCIGTKITLRFADETLVEMTCGRDIREIEIYYAEARVPDDRRAVLRGDEKLLTFLQSCSAPSSVDHALVRQLVSEVVYYVLSLRPLEARNDQYKYYFHNNIVFHNLVRLKALEAGKPEFNYLPLHAIAYLGTSDLAALPYRIGDDMGQHYGRLVERVVRFLSATPLRIQRREQYVQVLTKTVQAQRGPIE